MKKLVAFSFLLLLLGCKPSDIDPRNISYFEYTNVFGFTGSISTIRISPTSRINTQHYPNQRICENPITPALWQTLIDKFDYQEFKQLPSKIELGCCDRGSRALKINVSGKVQTIEWEFLDANSYPKIYELEQLLETQRQEHFNNCR